MVCHKTLQGTGFDDWQVSHESWMRVVMTVIALRHVRVCVCVRLRVRVNSALSENMTVQLALLAIMMGLGSRCRDRDEKLRRGKRRMDE